MSITKPELVKYVIPKVWKWSSFQIWKEFHLSLIVVFLFSTILDMIFLICIYYTTHGIVI